MTQKGLASNKSLNMDSFLHVDKEIDFMVDHSSSQYSLAVPTEKTIELSRKTYSKRNPITYHHYSVSPDKILQVNGNKSVANASIPNRRSLPVEERKISRGKRNRDSQPVNSKSLPPQKMRRKDTNDIKIIHQKINVPESSNKLYKSSSNTSLAADPDVEILEVKDIKQNSTKARLVGPLEANITNISNCSNTKGRSKDKLEILPRKKNTLKTLPQQISKSCYPSNEEVLINEADTAPIMPSSVIPDGTVTEASNNMLNASTSMKWLSADGTIAFSQLNNDSCPATKETKMKYAQKYLFLPEMKIIEKKKKSSGSRELKGLYNNLNEISWAHEESFQKLLVDKKGHIGHSDHTVRRTGVKNLRQMKATMRQKLKPQVKKNSAAKIIALKKAKIAKLKHKVPTKRLPVKRVNKKTVISKQLSKKKNIIKQRMNLIKKHRISNLRMKKHVVINRNSKKINFSTKKGKKINTIGKKNINANVKKTVINPNLKKLNVIHAGNKKVSVLNANGKKKGITGIGKKINSANVSNKKLNISPIVKKAVVNISDKKSSSTPVIIKKLNDNNLKNDIKKTKIVPKIVLKEKDSVVPKAKVDFSVASGSGTQNTCNNFKTKVCNSKPCTNNEAALLKHVFKNFEKFEVSNDIEHFRSIISGDNDIYSALQRGSKLRVTLEPLEHTNLWTSDFYETFRKEVMQQALLKALEKRDLESINAMFRELQESFINPQNNIKVTKKKRPEEETLRSSVRQSEGAFRYKEIVVKKHANYMQFVLVPNPSKQNSLTIEAMKELKDAFLLAKRDPNCKAVLLNSSGTYFCTGIDLSQLIGANKKQVADEMATTIKDLVITLGLFTKPVIAAVNGATVGFGVSLLTFCDVVLASDKATFCVPATRLGYLPEGGITLTLPQVVGAGVATEMLMQGRRLTAEQALRHGLVSEVLWPTQLMNEVIPRIQTIVSQPLTVMETTKSMVRCHLWDKLKPHVEREWRLLPPFWLDSQCQHNIKRILQTGWLID